MLNQKKLLQAFGLFWGIFLGLTLLFSRQNIQNGLADAHAKLFGGLAKTVLPDYIKFEKIEGTADGKMLFAFYDKRLLEEAKRKKLQSAQVSLHSYQNNPSSLINVTLFFLLALCLSVPLPWLKRLWITVVSILFFYSYTAIRMYYRIKVKALDFGISNPAYSTDDIMFIKRLDASLSAFGVILILIIVIWAAQVLTVSNIKAMKMALMK